MCVLLLQAALVISFIARALAVRIGEEHVCYFSMVCSRVSSLEAVHLCLR